MEFFTYFIRFIKKQDTKQSLLLNYSQPLLNLIYTCVKKAQYDSEVFSFDESDKTQEGYDQT